MSKKVILLMFASFGNGSANVNSFPNSLCLSQPPFGPKICADLDNIPVYRSEKIIGLVLKWNQKCTPIYTEFRSIEMMVLAGSTTNLKTVKAV